MRVYTLPCTSEAEVLAAGRKVPKVPSLLFEIENDLDEKALEAARGATLDDAEYVRRIKLYSEPWTQAEAKLADLVELAKGHGGAGAPRGEAEVAAFVGSRGYTVTLRTALGGRSNTECLKNLRHTFITCRQHGWPHAQHFIVDLCFREQFEICRPTPRYTEALACVPEVFVGAEERLLALVEVLCREMTAAFAESGTPLPPWRQAAAMLSKWQPRRSQDISLAPRAASRSPPRSPRPAGPGEGSVRGSPFAAHARATFANISNAALSAFMPASQLPSGPCKPTPRARPRSSLLAASLNGSSGPLPPNIGLPARGPAAAAPAGAACQLAAPRRQLPGAPQGAQRPLLREPSCGLSWADSAASEHLPAGNPGASSGGLFEAGRGSSLARGGGGGSATWASSLLGMEQPQGGRGTYLVTGF